MLSTFYDTCINKLTCYDMYNLIALGVSFIRLRLNGCSKPFEPDTVHTGVGKW